MAEPSYYTIPHVPGTNKWMQELQETFPSDEPNQSLISPNEETEPNIIKHMTVNHASPIISLQKDIKISHV